MNHYDARQMEASGLWHYTCANRRSGTHPVGYCSPWVSCPECGSEFGRECSACDGRGVIRSTAPCPGHETAEGAREHYREYLLDHARYDGRWAGVRHQCEAEGCDEWTDAFAEVGWRTFTLCGFHRNRAVIGPLFGPVAASFGSL